MKEFFLLLSYFNFFLGKGRALLLVAAMFLIGYLYRPTELGPTLSDSKHYICQTFNGRLGNHIYQYASIFGIARLNNLTMILGKNDDLARYFKVPSAEIRPSRRFCRSFVKKNAKLCCTFEPNMMHLDKNKDYILGEYLQSWRYFSHVTEQVRRELTFKDDIKESAVYIVDNYRAAYSARGSGEAVVIGIHIRRGDIVTNPLVVKDGPRPAPENYIHKAVDVFLQRFPNAVFLVCSDDMEYAELVFRQNSLHVHFVNVSPVLDLAILASCDHVIMTHGTFGWWAGFLSNGTVIYYKYPTREGSHARTEYNYEDYFPPNWIGME